MDTAALNAIRFRDDIDLVAVTGGPCGGKDTMMVRTRQALESRGFAVRVIPEVATELIAGGFDPTGLHWPKQDPLPFQKHVLLSQLEREQRVIRMVAEQRPAKRTVVLANRGAVDGRAYVSHAAFDSMVEKEGFALRDLFLRYKGAVHMVTAADGAEEYYTTANNEARRETPEEARVRDQRTQYAWLGHPHFHIIDNRAARGFDAKCHRALIAIARMLNMEEPLEKEHWYVLRHFKRSMIPQGAVKLHIVQNYLLSTGDGVRRVRQSTHDGVVTYYYAEKRDTAEPGARAEREREIDAREYETLLRERDPALQEIEKVRHCFPHSNRHFELDEFCRPVRNFFKLEVEVSDLSEPISVPIAWNALRVTGDDRYSSYSIAAGRLPKHEYA